MTKTNDRIKSTYRYGTGDNGTSLLMNGRRISKSDKACWVYSDVSHLILDAAEVLASYKLQCNELSSILSWLQLNSHSIGGFCFMLGDSPDNAIDLAALERLDKLTKELSALPEINAASDFIIQTQVKYIKLDRVRCRVRDLELSFVTWSEHLEVRNNILEVQSSNPTKAQVIWADINNYIAFLNRLSTVLWFLTRYEYYLEFGSLEGETQWQGKLSPLNTEVVVDD